MDRRLFAAQHRPNALHVSIFRSADTHSGNALLDTHSGNERDAMVANEDHNTQYKLNRIEVSMKKNQGLLSTEAHHASQSRDLLF